jgi:hypothetical protein
MRKFLSLMLSATLTIGTALSAYAAPLKPLTKASAAAVSAPSKSKMAARVQPIPANAKKFVRNAKDMGFHPTVAQTNIKGIYNGSASLKTNKRAARSASVARRISGSVQPIGAMAYIGDREDLDYNLYYVPTADGADFDLYGGIDMSPCCGYEDGEGSYICTYLYSFWGFVFGIYAYEFDTTTWEVISETELSDYALYGIDLARDPSTGDVYGCFYSADGSDLVWAKADYANCTSEEICSLDVLLMGVGCSKAGQYYGIDSSNNFYKIDKETGELTLVATVDEDDLPSYYLSSGCYNDKDGTFLMTYNSADDEGGIVEINVETGEVVGKHVFDYGEEVVGLYIPSPNCDDKAPADVEFSATCEGGSMDVNLSVTLPTTLFDGTPVPNDAFSFTVVDENDNVLWESSGLAGSVNTFTYTYATDGVHNLKAYASNGVGDGPKAKASVYVGKGTPAAPANVSLAWADGQATLTWDAVTASSDGGYLDPEAVTYTVSTSAGEVVSEAQAATSFSAAVAEPEDGALYLKYSVKANYDAKESAEVVSNGVFLGAYNAPFAVDFTGDDAADFFDQHSIVDANADGRTWKLDGTSAYYPYSTANDGDDWLMSPPVMLEAGQAYIYTITARSQSSYFPERMEVFYGSDATVEAMTTEVIPSTDLVATFTDYTAVIAPTESGKYYFGIHATSDADQYYLRVQGYSIGAPMEATAPAAVEGLKVTPNISGALDATVTFTNPTTDLTGAALSGNVNANIYVDDEFVTSTNGAKGAEMSATVTVAERGTYTIKVVPENLYGEAGVPSSASAYFGPKQPAAAANRNGYESETAAGTVVLVWDPVTTATDGSEILASNITYNVYGVNEDEDGNITLGTQLNSAPITDCTFTIAGEASASQKFVQYVVQSMNLDVEGGYYLTNPICVGPAYEVPALMSADDESLAAYPMAVSVSDSSSSLSIQDEEFVESADGDGAVFAFYGGSVGSEVDLYTGKFKIDGLDNPIVKFYNYKIAEADTNILTVYAMVNGVKTELETIDRDEVENVGGWNEYKVDLSAYKGKTIQLIFAAQTVSYYYTIVDAINICDNLAYDLSAKISAPSKVEAGETFNVTVTVKNEGAQDSGAYTVELFRDGEQVASDGYPILALGESETFEFEQTLGLDVTEATYKAVVSYEQDMDLNNNETEAVKVSRKLSNLPTVTGLAGEKTDAGNVLTWDPIVIDNETPAEYTESFEDAEPWAQDEFDDWTFVDNDGAAVGGFANFDFPGITQEETACAWFVVDYTDEAVYGYSNLVPQDGDKYLASMYNAYGEQNDDWAISPALPGMAQTITFWCRSVSDTYNDDFQVWYSTTDTDLESFTMVEEVGTVTVPAAWTEYSANLPEGTKYFAIRHCSTNQFMLYLDNVTYTRIGGFKGTLAGYNVYRDGVKINDALLTDATYTDAEAGDEAHTYTVTAVYDLGESEFSDAVTIEASGIVSVKGGEGLSISTEGKFIVVKGAGEKAVTINAIDGKTYYNAVGDARVQVNSAIYLVTVGKRTVKVIVR